MRLAEFDYTLPKELIAQYPSEKRGDDRLLVLDREKNFFEEKRFRDIVDYFKEGDLLLLNNTKVIPARLFARRKTGGRAEIFIIDKSKKPLEALVRSSGKIKEDESVILESGGKARIGGRAGIGRLVEFDAPIDEVLEKCGHVPLPPYISRADEPGDRIRYQTVYAASEGATASPTAGLHFTESVIDKIKKIGVRIAYVTLHTSYGTFAPIKEQVVEKHKMHPEFYHISKEEIMMIGAARGRNARVFSCGTTSLRALETCAGDIIKGRFRDFSGVTDLFIYPGYRFRIANKLITNFHLPKSTLLLLASAFAGKKLLFDAYKYAVENKFRFFSYGDCMLIL